MIQVTPQKITVAALSLTAVMLAFSTFYTVEEGHVGIVKRFNEAVKQVDPGLHVKIPFIDDVVETEVRTRKNVEQMPSSTYEQMPVTAEVSVNWTIDKSQALDLFRKYGGIDQFEQRILDPRFRSAVKDALPKQNAEELVRDRATAISRITANLMEEIEGLPIVIDNVQIENLVLPPKYLDSIEIKQTELNLSAAEEHKLTKQGFTAMQQVNTADAQAQGIEKVAQAEANAIRMKGLAEAEAITAKAKALQNNPLIVELTKAQRWDGKQPNILMTEGAASILDTRSSSK